MATTTSPRLSPAEPFFHPTLSPADAWASVGRLVVDVGKEVEAHAAWKRAHKVTSAHIRLEQERRRRASAAAYARFWDGLRALLPASITRDLDGWGFSVPSHMKHGRWDAQRGKGRCTWNGHAAASPQGLAVFAARLLVAGHLASLQETQQPGPFASTFHRVAFDRHALVANPTRYGGDHKDNVLLPRVFHAATPRMAVVQAILLGHYIPMVGLRRDPVAAFHEHFSHLMALAQASAVLSAPGLLSDLHTHPLAKAVRRAQGPGLAGTASPLKAPSARFATITAPSLYAGQPDLSNVQRTLAGPEGAQGRRAAAWREVFAHFDAQVAAITAFFDRVEVPPAPKRDLALWALDLPPRPDTHTAHARGYWALDESSPPTKAYDPLAVGLGRAGVTNLVYAWSADSAAALAILEGYALLHPLAYGLTADKLLALPAFFHPVESQAHR